MFVIHGTKGPGSIIVLERITMKIKQGIATKNKYKKIKIKKK